MNLRTLLRLAATALIRNRTRSLLTMLGVIIGVAAVVVTIAIGSGARNSVAQQINALGSNLIMVIPGNVTMGGVRTGTGGASTLTVDDGLAVARLPHVAAVTPGVGARAQLIAGDHNWQTMVTGAAPTFTYIRQWPLAEGAFFNDTDTASAAKVAVLGQTVVNNLFPDGSSPVGKTISIRNVPFTVIGVLTARGQSAIGQDQDDTVVIPYTSAMKRLTGSTYVSVLAVSAESDEYINAVQGEIVRLLEQRHQITSSAQDDFSVRSLQDIATAASATASVMEYLLAGVGAVSLIVGGIGIMNIMLVSVTERTREIGLRISVGARASAILSQFLIEAVVLSTVGGAIGALLGVLASRGIALFGGWPTTVSPYAILLAFAFSALIGVFFGYYPASKAARLHPIEALRFE